MECESVPMPKGTAFDIYIYKSYTDIPSLDSWTNMELVGQKEEFRLYYNKIVLLFFSQVAT